MKALHMIAFILVLIGGLNWGLVGIMDLDLIERFIGADSIVSTIIYVLVGLSAVYLAITHKHDCKVCSAGGSSPSMPQM